MHQPRPHGQLAVGAQPTNDDVAAIELLTRRLTNIKQISGVDSLRMVRALPDGGYVIAQDMGGVLRVITHKSPGEPAKPDADGLAKEYIPMLFSGTITRAIIEPDEGVGIRLTEQTRRRLANYDPERLPESEVFLKRFAIGYGFAFSEFEPQTSGRYKFTQYVALRPTWYSGAMAEVMQIVGGYGIQRLGELPDDQIERARVTVPEIVARKIRIQIGENVRLPGYTGLPAPDGKFLYDYKAHSTDAVAFDSAGRPWLVRLNQSGVWAMPLPLIPATTTTAFREHMDAVGDGEILHILNRFGGMPSGETFPSKEADFQAWRRAGVIIRVCDSGGFHDHIMYSSSTGWSLNSSGSEGFATCYDYYDDEGLGYGLAFKLRMSLSPAEHDGKLPPALKPEDADEATMLDAYLSSLYRLIAAHTPTNLAIKYKLRRVDPSDILARAENGEASESDVTYWDNLEVPPIAIHSGSVREVGRGYLYHGAKFEFQPQIKFPEPLFGGCISHDFLPLINGRYKSSYPRCDTIMHGYYVGDDLKVVKYFRDPRAYVKEVESDYEECMIVGSWTQTETIGGTSLLGHFYSTDFDERKPVSEHVTTTKIVGRDMGFGTPGFGFDYIFAMQGDIYRNRYFSRTTEVTHGEGHSASVAVCIPYLCRNALIHAYQEGMSGGSLSKSAARYAVRDPTSYRMWTYDFVFHWHGGPAAPASGKPFPRYSYPVWVESESYDPYPCSDFADQGPWIPDLPADYAWLVHPKADTYSYNGGDIPPPFQPYSTITTLPGKSSGHLKISILDTPGNVHSQIPANGYFISSPNDIGDLFYRDACRVVFGLSTYANVSENPDGPLRAYWGHSGLVDHKSAHHFIGVINE